MLLNTSSRGVNRLLCRHHPTRRALSVFAALQHGNNNNNNNNNNGHDGSQRKIFYYHSSPFSTAATAPVQNTAIYTWGEGSDGQLGHAKFEVVRRDCAVQYPA